MDCITTKLIEAYSKWGLNINTSKTKHLVVGELLSDIPIENEINNGRRNVVKTKKT